jgi:hypothetical protein
MSDKLNPRDPHWRDYRPEPHVFKRTETPHVYRFLFVHKNTKETRDVECRWEDLSLEQIVSIDSDEVQKILDEDRSI